MRIVQNTFFALLVIGVFVFYFYGGSVAPSFEGGVVERVEKVASIIEDDLRSAQKVITPEPLRFLQEGVSSDLTVNGILLETNEARVLNGRKPLTLNSRLSVAATSKAQDMLALGYFDHVSPEGKGVSDVISEAGYEYILVGENLAMGNFKDDEALVQAWMDSPGHRANILKEDFSEIGIGFVYGEMDGREVALAVQEFGRPRSECPAIDEMLQSEIDTKQFSLKQRAAELEMLRDEMEAEKNKRSVEYREKVEFYNRKVDEYNGLLKEVKQLIGVYNEQVQAFNECIK